MKNKKTIYTHQELALLYFPDILPESASRQLSRRILRDEELYAELLKAGYMHRQRIYSPLQIAILFDHLGDPETWLL
ncbi:MAG: DUF4248 domain-containing protein [Tannerellaceae bacterium]|jgi:hypothetical protein|nr:DUF4248 domain-containing protein [Tannerellaceae bacterium]